MGKTNGWAKSIELYMSLVFSPIIMKLVTMLLKALRQCKSHIYRYPQPTKSLKTLAVVLSNLSKKPTPLKSILYNNSSSV